MQTGPTTFSDESSQEREFATFVTSLYVWHSANAINGIQFWWRQADKKKEDPGKLHGTIEGQMLHIVLEKEWISEVQIRENETGDLVGLIFLTNKGAMYSCGTDGPSTKIRCGHGLMGCVGILGDDKIKKIEFFFSSGNKMQRDDLLIDFTCRFVPLWDGSAPDTSEASSDDCGPRVDHCCTRGVSFWRPDLTAQQTLEGYSLVGDFVAGDKMPNPNNIAAMVVCKAAARTPGDTAKAPLVPPEDFEQVWTGGPLHAAPVTVWHMIAPAGYCSLGLVCTPGKEPPDRTRYCCVRADLTVPGHAGREIFKSTDPQARFSCWAIEANHFATSLAHDHPGYARFSVGTFAGSAGPAPNYECRCLEVELRDPAPAAGMASSLTLPSPAISPQAGEEAYRSPAITRTVLLPWFSVEDDELPSDADRLALCPNYILKYTERYKLIDSGCNRSSVEQSKSISHSPSHSHQDRTFWNDSIVLPSWCASSKEEASTHSLTMPPGKAVDLFTTHYTRELRRLDGKILMSDSFDSPKTFWVEYPVVAAAAPTGAPAPAAPTGAPAPVAPTGASVPTAASGASPSAPTGASTPAAPTGASAPVAAEGSGPA